MKYPYIKNIAHEEALALSGQVVTQPGQIVSNAWSQNGAVSITLFAFDKDEEISTHDSDGDAMATVLEGTGQFTVDGRIHLLNAGETLVMPAKKPHAVFAKEQFKMLLVVVFPYEKDEK